MKDDYRSFNEKDMIEQINFVLVKVFVCYETRKRKLNIAMADNKQLAEALEKIIKKFFFLRSVTR